jgi:hypothetical protein
VFTKVCPCKDTKETNTEIGGKNLRKEKETKQEGQEIDLFENVQCDLYSWI